MKVITRNILAVVLGAVLGSIVNMGIIVFGGSLVPPPEGADVITMEGLKASMHLFQPIHFLMPFLAHALGTFFGALVAMLVAANHKEKFSYGIGILFMLGGIANVFMLPSPLWFSILDVLGAYLPMSILAIILVRKRVQK
ncbi:hypothetical protein EHQ58_09895 [Leptospira ognonensis]|uniref:Uncharacterized protein n=1 Tax=Leptospira ognonensis TaxID=2484945 RepID=A0A4R9K219_9LEPT|nr:hypothetical protein [Leptospira ognonensis]TGL59211.1 hypothetical protein EHQ58_09895 [Leptospira ognonensis]